MWRHLAAIAIVAAVTVAVAAPVPAPSGKFAPIPAADPDAAGYDDPPKGALLRFGSRQMRHPGGVVGNFAADGLTLFTAGRGRICEWDTGTNALRRVYPLPVTGDLVGEVGVIGSPDGRLVVVRGMAELHVFDRATKKELHALHIPGQALGCFAVSPDGKTLAAATSEGRVCQFDLTTGKPLDFSASHPLPPPTADEIADPTLRRKDLPPIPSLAWSPNGKTLVSCSEGHGLIAWNAVTGEERWAFANGGASGKIAFTADGKRVVVPMKTTAVDGTALLDAATGELAEELDGFAFGFGIAASADGRFLCNGKAVWDVKAGKVAHALQPTYWTKGLAISADGTRVAFAPGDVRVYDLAAGKELGDGTGHAGEVVAVAASPDGKRVATAADDTVRLWDAATGKPAGVFCLPESEPTAVGFSPDGKSLAIADYKTVRVYDLATGKEVWATSGYGLGKHVAFSPDGKTVACGGRGLTVHLYDARTGEESRTLAGEVGASNLAFRFAWTADSTGIVSPVNLSPGRGRAAPGGPGGEGDGKFRVVLWDAATGERVRALGDPADECPSAVALSPDGKLVAVGGKAVSLVAWKTGERKWTADVPGRYGLAFAGDDRLYADEVRLHAATGEKDAALKTGPKALRALAVSPNGKRVFTASADDNTVVVWPR